MSASMWPSDDQPPKHPNCRAYVRFGTSDPIPIKGLEITFDHHTDWVRKYVWKQVARGRDYVSLTKMAAALGLRYDQCETAFTILRAEHKVPTDVVVVEEVEG